MAWEKVARCDVCRAVKGAANKWLLVAVRDNNTPGLRSDLFQVFHWDDDIAKEPHIKIICSESCLQRILQPFLDSRTNQSTISPAPALASAPTKEANP